MSIAVGSCNHDRAPIYYAESINSKEGFWGFKCKDWSEWALGRCNSKTSNETAEMGWRVSKEYVINFICSFYLFPQFHFLDGIEPRNNRTGAN